MSAMTEMPAKTPNPIGKTCNFLPGIVNGVAEALEFSAAAVPEEAAPAELIEVEVGVPLEDDALSLEDEAADVELELEAVAVAVDAEDVIEMEVTGSTESAAEDEVDVVPVTVESVEEDVEVAVEEEDEEEEDESVVVAETDVLVADGVSVDEAEDPTRATVHSLTSTT